MAIGLARTTGMIFIMSELPVYLFWVAFACISLHISWSLLISFPSPLSCLQRLEYRRFSVMNNFVIKKVLEY